MRIGIVKLSSIGDVVHALPVAAALRRAFPGATIAWIVEAREAALLEDQPDIDRVVRADTRQWRRLLRRRQIGPTWRGVGSLRAELRALGLDVVLDLQGLLKSGVIAWLARAPLRIGFAASRCREPLSALFTNARVAPPASAVHVVHQYLALLAPLGVPCRTPEFRLGAWPAARARMDEFLFEGGVKPGDRLVALNPGAGLPDKRWPVGHFRALAERLAVEAQARSLILWGPEESSLAREIATSLAGRPLLAPPTDLHELAALLRRVSLMVAGDTGPLHLAAAVGAPTLGLFGPTRAARNGPYGARAASLQSATGRMDGLEPGVVFEAAQDLLDAA